MTSRSVNAVARPKLGLAMSAFRRSRCSRERSSCQCREAAEKTSSSSWQMGSKRVPAVVWSPREIVTGCIADPRASSPWPDLPSRLRLALLDDGSGDAAAWRDVHAFALGPLANGLVLLTIAAGRSDTTATGGDAVGWRTAKLLGSLQVGLQPVAELGGVLLG